MTVETPDHYGGKPIPDDAIEIALAAEKKNRNEGEAPSLDGFIYIPSIKLYFENKKTCLGKDRFGALEELHERNLRIPTIPQFIEFLKHLRANPTTENTRVYDEIIKKRNPWRAVLLDGNFYDKSSSNWGDKELWFIYNHIIDNENLVAPTNGKLEGHLMQDRNPGAGSPGIDLEYWLNNPTKQGLPPVNVLPGDLWYRYPRKGCGPKFVADSGGAGLDCGGDSLSHSNLGVFACAEKPGEKQ